MFLTFVKKAWTFKGSKVYGFFQMRKPVRHLWPSVYDASFTLFLFSLLKIHLSVELFNLYKYRLFLKIFIDLRESENINLLFHLLMYSLVDSWGCPDQGWNLQPWCMEMILQPAECPASAKLLWVYLSQTDDVQGNMVLNAPENHFLYSSKCHTQDILKT